MTKASRPPLREKSAIHNRKALIHAAVQGGPPLNPDYQFFLAMIPDFDKTREWKEAIAASAFGKWRFDVANAGHLEQLQGAIATNIIRKLRDAAVRNLIAQGDPFWLAVA